MKRLLTSLCFLVVIHLQGQTNNYEIGIGISDITGQIAQSNFFGYGNPFFSNSGIKDRQYARAFIVKEPNGKPVVFVNIDKGAVFQSVNQAVLQALRNEFGTLYTDSNLIISATHTHVSPGGYSHYELYNTATGGHYKTNFSILISGIVQAIKQAHEHMSPGRIYYNKGYLTNASINRSLVAYQLNKDANAYPSIDQEMTVLKFIQGNRPVGMLSWFAVHPTNLTKTYKFCSGDNKGYAALEFERLQGTQYRASPPQFIAAFANSNAGDMSPNLRQPAPDDPRTDASGPGATEEESAAIIGMRQYQKAYELFNSATIQLTGSVVAVTRYSDYSKLSIAPKFTDGEWRQTCKAALGLSFRAGAEDGRSGIGREGETRSNPTSGCANAQCHMEKPIDILFNIGANDANPRTPKILPTSLLKIGQLGILAAPGEFTVMAGRRMRKAVSDVPDTGIQYTVFTGYADAYAGYVTTREEYASQQYEGASTHFGPWTCAAYQQEFERLTTKIRTPLANPWPVPEPQAPVKSFIGLDKTAPILFDDKPLFKSFGSTIQDATSFYTANQTVNVSFWGGHPNNNSRTNGSYLAVQQLIEGSWITRYEDRDNSTKMEWKRSGIANSKIYIQWKIPTNVDAGTYRIVHYGAWKNGWTGAVKPYTATSRTFAIGQQRKALQKENANTSISLFPNPAKQYVQFANPQRWKGTVFLMNTLGQKVWEQSLGTSDIEKVSLRTLQRGVYLVHIRYENQPIVKTKLIKL